MGEPGLGGKYKKKKKKKKKERGRREEEEDEVEKESREKKWFFLFLILVIYSCRPKLVYRSELSGISEIRLNGLKFFLRWNKGVYCTNLYIGTRFSDRSG